jgi:hypothetical protein
VVLCRTVVVSLDFVGLRRLKGAMGKWWADAALFHDILPRHSPAFVRETGVRTRAGPSSDHLWFETYLFWIFVSESEIKKAAFERAAFGYSSLVLLYHKVIGLWDIFAEIFHPSNHGDRFRRGVLGY